ncbi:helix-turn-helix transcriptional regulator [uncultured Maricaulis sp.]|uniref:helix-turn-helix domain-containing protein n=1 Tax=uncultured Maricaulis sp. TaxID=174710 RepID=UPI0030DD6B3A|tara:strand:- start:158394 stop:158747 length:354 start_codon:yes stop_codon:yes gene_type:complete
MEHKSEHIQPINRIVEDLGIRLEAYRISRGIKQADLAAKAGISRSTLMRLEAGTSGTIDSLVRVLQALDLTDRLSDLVPDAALSPLDPMSETGQRRLRVRDRKTDAAPWSWDDEPGK